MTHTTRSGAPAKEPREIATAAKQYDGISIALGGDTAPIPMSPLRVVLTEAADKFGLSAKDLTVLAAQNDPFRLDTPARHRDGEWLGMHVRRTMGDRQVHLRGLHYMLIGETKPDGKPYTNTDADWLWISGDAGKAARWLGYVPFDQITDQRNAAPTVRIFAEPEPAPWLHVGLDVTISDADDLLPEINIDDFTGVQPYKLVFFGEKSSLDGVLGPLAQRFHADLCLPTGEISDTLMHKMASIGAADGRPMIVFTFSDADPAGWQMPVSIARKLQAFKASLFPDLEFQVQRVGLTPAQVRAYGLPSTPLKETEKRADRWRQAMGVQQTEIDALASLRPNLLRDIAKKAVKPFFDATLAERVRTAKEDWLGRAQEAVMEQLDTQRLEQVRSDAVEKLAGFQAEIDRLNREFRIDIDDLDIPEAVVPEAEVDESLHPLPLVDSRWPFAHHCQQLIASKAYAAGGGD